MKRRLYLTRLAQYSGIFHCSMVRVQQKLYRGINVFHYFGSHDWKFAKNNILELRKELSEEDKKVFRLTNHGIFNEEFFLNSVLVARHYLLKEDPATLPAARRRLKV